MSYDTISHDILEEIKKAESKPARKSILSFLEQPDDDKPTPVQSRTPATSTMNSTTNPSTPYTNSNSTTLSPPLTPAPPVVVLPPELIAKEKKALRTGRKKVNITTNGEVIPIVPDDHSPSNSTSKIPSGVSTVETLDNIMMELEKKEAEATLRQNAVPEPRVAKEGCKRYFCCFQNQKVTS